MSVISIIKENINNDTTTFFSDEETVLSFLKKAYTNSLLSLDDSIKTIYKTICSKEKDYLLDLYKNKNRHFVLTSESLTEFKTALNSLKKLEERESFKDSKTNSDIIPEDDRKNGYDNGYNLTVEILKSTNDSSSWVTLDSILESEITNSDKTNYIKEINSNVEGEVFTEYYITYRIDNFYVNFNNEYSEHTAYLYDFFNALEKTFSGTKNYFDELLKEYFYKIVLNKYREKEIDEFLTVEKNSGSSITSKITNSYDRPNGRSGNIGNRRILNTAKIKKDRHTYDDIKCSFDSSYIEEDENGCRIHLLFTPESLYYFGLPNDLENYFNKDDLDHSKLISIIKENVKTIKPYIFYGDNKNPKSFYIDKDNDGVFKIDEVTFVDEYIHIIIKDVYKNGNYIIKKRWYSLSSSTDKEKRYNGYCYVKYVNIKVGDNIINEPVYSKVPSMLTSVTGDDISDSYYEYSSNFDDTDICVAYKMPSLVLERNSNGQNYTEYITYKDSSNNEITKPRSELIDSDGDISSDIKSNIIKTDILLNVYNGSNRVSIKYYNDTNIIYQNNHLYLDCSSFGDYNGISFIDQINVLNIDSFDEAHVPGLFNKEFRFFVDKIIKKTSSGAYIYSSSPSVSNGVFTDTNSTASLNENSSYTLNLKDSEIRSSGEKVEEMYLRLYPKDKAAMDFVNDSFLPNDVAYSIEASGDTSLRTKEVIITSFVMSDGNSMFTNRLIEENIPHSDGTYRTYNSKDVIINI